MNKLTSAVVLTGVLALGYYGTEVSGRVPDARDAQVASQGSQGQIRAQLTDRQVQVILTRIRTNAETLLTTIDGPRARGRVYGTRARQDGDVAYLVDDLVAASVHMSDHVTRRETTRTDLDDLLGRADAVEEALTRNPAPAAGQTAWRNIRRDIEGLATAYGVTWDWQNPQYPGIPGTGVYQRLTGTYRMDPARSDDPQRVVDTAVRSMPAANRARVTRQLLQRLDPPEVLAIDRNNRQVIIGSSLGSQVTLDADGQTRTERDSAGRTVTTRATVYGDQLEVTTTGAANLDYSVTFEPVSNGQELSVTRRIYNDALTQPVTLRTIYRRTSETPDWTLSERATDRVNDRSGMLVPNGTVLTATLDQTVNLRNAKDDDRITLLVRNSPRAELEGATIEGYVRQTQSASNDNRGVVVLFDQIRLRNGRTSEFDGVIERMIGPNGETIKFDGEQVPAESGRTQESIERGAIGAAVGAILGAIVGGGKGAAIGAVLGGGGAAATVLIDSTNKSELVRGTEFTIRSRTR